jgi:hypothetical protein
MPTIINNLLDQLAGLLGPLSPFAKAVVPAILAVAVAAVNSAFAGKIDATSLAIAGSGLVLALITFLIPNRPNVTPIPVPVVPVAKK